MNNSLLLILLSALLCNASFFFIESLGCMIFMFPIPLFYCLMRHHRSLFSSFGLGLLWGMLFFGGHCIWLFHLLVTKTCASGELALFLYSFVVIALSLTSGAWFFCVTALKNVCAQLRLPSSITFILLFATMPLYFLCVSMYATWFLESSSGYPLTSPLIPLWGWYQPESDADDCHIVRDIEILHLTPHKNLYASHPEEFRDRNPYMIGQDIYHKLARALSQPRSSSLRLICLPEGSFPFPLNEHQDSMSLWQCALGTNDYLILGARRAKGEKTYQSLFCIAQDSVIFVHDKTLLADFAEKIPRYSQGLCLATSLFGNSSISFKEGKGEESLYPVSGNVFIRPYLCLEAFVLPFEKDTGSEKKRVLHSVLLNTSWFMPYFRKIMKYYLSMEASWKGIELIVVDY